MAVIRGFRAFLLRGNVIDLATAVVIGAAFNSLVQAMVRDFVTPLIAMMGGKRDYSGLIFTIRGTEFAAGDFLNIAISFLIVSATLYFFVVLPFNRLAELYMPQPPQAPMRECPYCLSKIPEEASRCMYCTSEVRRAA